MNDAEDIEGEDSIDDGRIVTIARYDQSPQAHIACAMLEAAGIPAMVAGENNPGLFLFHALVGRSVELQVFEQDAAAAMAILKSPADSASPEDAEGPSIPGEPNASAACSSPAPPHEPERLSRIWFFPLGAAVFLLFASPFISPEYAAPVMFLYLAAFVAQILLIRKRARMPGATGSSLDRP